MKKILAFCSLLTIYANAQTPPPLDPEFMPPEDDITLTSLPAEKGDNHIPFEQLTNFVDIFDVIKRYYVEPIDNGTLIENAIRGMLVRLDPHSTYMNEREYHDFIEESEGVYAGVGVILDVKDGSVRVITAVADSPAAKAGIKTGDIISQVDGQSLNDMSSSEINQIFNGEEGTDVTLTIQRDETLFKIKLTREIIYVTSVSSSLLNDNFAYLRITQFQEDTAINVAKEIESLQVKSPLNGLILDLRNNGGGLLDSAVETADLFLDHGNIVSIRGRDYEEKFDAEAGDLLNGKPIVVLINEGTASASEVLAAALQENNRALSIGQNTFGKGSVQTVKTLYHGGAIKLTTYRYYTPSGQSIQATGITPQIPIGSLKLQTQKKNIDDKESNLPRHLEASNAIAPSPKSNTESLAMQDFALYEAINILTAMQLMNKLMPAATTTPENGSKPKPEPSAGTIKTQKNYW